MLKKLLGETAIYGLSSILGRTLNYLLVPLYTSIFLPGEYGVVTELYAYMAFLNVIFTYGLETTYFRFSTKKVTQDFDYFRLTQSLLFLSTVIFGGVLYFLASPIALLLEYAQQPHLIQWMVIILCLDTLVVLPFARLRLQNKAVKFAAFKLTNILLNIAFNLFFLLFCPWILEQEYSAFQQIIALIYEPDLGVGYVFLSNLLANAIYMILFSRTWLKFRFSWSADRVRQVLKYALPLLILGLAGVTNEMLSRAMLKYRLPEGFYSDLSNMDALGIFGGVYKLSIFMVLTVQAFKYAYEPFFFKSSERTDGMETNSRVLNAFIYFMCIGWLVLTVILPEIAPIFLRDPIYLSGLKVVPLLLGAGGFLGIFYNLSVWYKLTDNNWYGAIISLSGGVVTVLLNYFLIPLFGYMGSAWASFFTYLLMAVISYNWGRKFYPAPYLVLRGLVYLSMTFTLVLIINFLEMSLLTRYLIGIIGLSVFILTVWKLEKPKLFSNFEP